MTASDQYRESRGGKKTPAIRGKPGSWYAPKTRAPRGPGGLGEAPDVYDFEPPSFRRLYKIAHSESTVDYVDNPGTNWASCPASLDFHGTEFASHYVA
jgi:hypothetical protein